MGANNSGCVAAMTSPVTSSKTESASKEFKSLVVIEGLVVKLIVSQVEDATDINDCMGSQNLLGLFISVK